jgi:hypothetical protein
MAKCMEAKVKTSLYFGAVAQTPEATLGQRIRKKAYKVGVKLASYG